MTHQKAHKHLLQDPDHQTPPALFARPDASELSRQPTFSEHTDSKQTAFTQDRFDSPQLAAEPVPAQKQVEYTAHAGHHFGKIAVHAPEQSKSTTVQLRRDDINEDTSAGTQPAETNHTGLPSELKMSAEQLSGYALDDVRVHYQSAKPAQLQALAYTQGREIHVAPGQERHLPHEVWHVVQQMRGHVQPTAQVNGVALNDEPRLEHEADMMGKRVLGSPEQSLSNVSKRLLSGGTSVAQLQKGLSVDERVRVKITGHPEVDDDLYEAVITAVSDDGEAYTVSFTDDIYNQLIEAKEFHESLVTPLRRVVRQEKPVLVEDGTPPWVKERLGFDASLKKSISNIVGEAKAISELSEDQLENLILLLKEKATMNLFVEQLIGSLEFDLKDLKENNETSDQMEEREKRITGEQVKLEEDAFEKLFGVKLGETTWQALWPAVLVWWMKVKFDESRLGFTAAFQANRMTARQINVGSTARGGRFQVQKLGSVPDKDTDREMFLDNTVGGIVKRTDPTNFNDQETVNQEGVHDLSASLLRGDKPIYEQLKSYQEAIVLFMPLPEEHDLQVFSALARLEGMDPRFISAISSLLTRPILAQSSDMGTRYVDTEGGSEGEGSFQYGLTGTVIRKPGDRARKINKADLASRKKGALSYKEIATASITKVNEVVMAYRQHASKLFPMYAAWDSDHKEFLVLTSDLAPTGHIISNNGEYND